MPSYAKKQGLGLKHYHFSESVFQAKQRLKLAEEAHKLRDKGYTGKRMYKGRLIPAVAATVAPKITGNTSGKSKLEQYKARRPSSEAVDKSIERLKAAANAKTE
jgi:hypothetical protein